MSAGRNRFAASVAATKIRPRLTGTPASLRGYMHLEREAAGAAIFVYPAGLRSHGSHGRSTTHWDTHGDGVDVAFFDALLARLGETHCVDMGRVFALGHSAGAVISNEMGCHRGNALRAIAPVAGSGPWSRQCAEAPSVWITHGRADAPVAFHYGEASRDHCIAATHCAPEGVADGDACVRYGGCAGDARVVFCAHGGDHGPPPLAARAIWGFFRGL
jgi:poly(3-hydroxybutyrate) depolymerase